MECIKFEQQSLTLLDQTLLPNTVVYHRYTDYRLVGEAIKTMVVRGAPAIGVTAGYAMVLAAFEFRNKEFEQFTSLVKEAAKELKATRPTAVNLFWAIDRMLGVLEQWDDVENSLIRLEKEAKQIHQEDVVMNRKMGEYGADLIPHQGRILTHCNAGALATGGYGTAVGVIRTAHRQGKVKQVLVDETRPLLQGARLTAFELVQENIPARLITDNMAGHFMQQGMVDCVIVGADRIAANGDVANKIGTYGVAVLAKYHGIPFYVAAPSSTFDLSIATGKDIPIEQRDEQEVKQLAGQYTAPKEIAAYNPAFDVTPNELITAIITEKGIIQGDIQEMIKRMFG